MEHRSIGMGVIIRWDAALPDATAEALTQVSTDYQRLTQGHRGTAMLHIVTTQAIRELKGDVLGWTFVFTYEIQFTHLPRTYITGHRRTR